MLIFGLFHVASNPKASMKGIIGVVILLVIFGIAYSISPAEPETAQLSEAITKFETTQDSEISASNFQAIGGSMITALILLGVSFIVLVGFGVRNIFK